MAASKLESFDASCFPSTPLWLHCFSFVSFAALPVAACFLSGAPSAAVALALAILLPRVLCSLVFSAGSAVHTVLLGLYWNCLHTIVFLSPFIVAYTFYLSPRLVGPCLLVYIARALVFRPSLSGDNAWPTFAQHEWGYREFRKYFPLTLHVPPALRARDSHAPAILAVHPHGVASDYRILMDGLLYAIFPKRKILTLAASVLFAIPLVRELTLWTRCIDARKKYASRALGRGCSLLVLPGGEAEQIATRHGRDQCFLAKRAARRDGAETVPHAAIARASSML